ncbi:nuclear transport factor 2 family protein [Mucilaginibacter ginsenosidivorans]|uniref:Nuclear transport factor 2 family protein n=2 Tax=Mucilaginibacter ginsenosidivorans TaxID=398053 RepID=A0A5B8UZC1_9SPHI|nr:nuclear transport factor 2 family protein [Mucilaginibacter ginsenosidivorans]
MLDCQVLFFDIGSKIPFLMKISHKALIVFAWICMCAVRANAQTTKDPDSKQAAIIAAMTKSANDWNRGDLGSFMKMYTDSSTMMMPTGPAGLSTIKKLYATKYFEGAKPKQQLYYSEFKVTMLGKKYALLTGKFTLKGNNLPERSGRYSLVMVSTKQGWKILHDHSS